MTSRPRRSPALLLAASALLLAPSAGAQRPATNEGYYREEFLAAVQRNMPVLQPCYDRSRAEGDAAWQRLRTVTVVINPDGTIGPITLNPGPGVPTIATCAATIIQRWRLTPPGGSAGLTLTYTRVQIERAMMPPRPRRGRH